MQISGGTNLALFMKRPTDDYWPTYNSTQLTSQLDVGVLDFGVITNTGELPYFIPNTNRNLLLCN
jgi:hypothetical protein